MLGKRRPERDLPAAIRQALRGVIDPEMGANIVDLNMIRRIGVMGDLAEIDLVLTTPDCPLAGWIAEQARQAACGVPGIAGAAVRVLDEPWQRPGQGSDWQDWVAGLRGGRD